MSARPTGGGQPHARAAGAAATIVVKIGGRALESPAAAAELAADLAALHVPAVLVHGGGVEVSAWCARLGIEPRFLDGLRVTDEPTLEVAAAVLGGLANQRLVAILREAGVDAVGLSALDGGIVEAEPHPDAARLGEVGAIAQVHPQLLDLLLAHGRVPVLSSIAAYRGRLLNVNADDLAAALAGTLKARALMLLSDTPALMLEGAAVTHLDRAGLDAAITHPDVRDGMTPKLIAIRAALEAGVGRVHLAAWQGTGTLHALLAGAGPGTVFEAEESPLPTEVRT